jgi:Cu2+-exporting ATPase/Cu+-exporting ATPase
MPVDPICGMFVPQNAEITAEKDGNTYYFCSTTCRIKFQKPEEASKKERLSLAIAWTFAVPVLVLTYFISFGMKDYVMLALALPVQFYSGLKFYRGAYQAIKMRSGNMDLLIALGTSAAFFFSLFVTLFPSAIPNSSTYFDTSTFIIALILTGNYIQDVTERKANDAANELIKRIPSRVNLVDSNGVAASVDLSEVKSGDIILIKPGENVPVDGTVIDGKTEVDESMISGEAEPVIKVKGSRVVSGTTNINGAVKVKVEQVGKDSTISKIYELIKQAATGRLKIQRLADAFSAYFVPVVIGIAIAAAVFWYVFLSFSSSGAVYEITVLAFVSVIIIACPCAIGLATPITLLVASNAASRDHLLLKNMSSLERLAKVNLVVFDKTGTLTDARPDIDSIISKSGGYSSESILKYAASLEQYSNHPIAKAIVEYAKDREITFSDISQVEEKPGVGVSGMLAEKSIDIRRSKEKNTVSLYIEGNPVGDIVLSYHIKSNAGEVVKKLNSIGMKTAMITGDKQEEAQRVGAAVGIDDIYAEVTPEKKADIIKAYQKKGYYVMYAGDGINDAIALETADVGVAIGTGSDIAKASGDVVMLNDDLILLYDLKRMGNSTISKIKQNIGWAIGYNAALIPIAGGALVPVFGLRVYSLLPIFAALAMGMSSVSVVLNSLLLKKTIRKQIGGLDQGPENSPYNAASRKA